MAITQNEAREALAAADRVASKSAQLYSYLHLAPFLFITGFLWLPADLLLLLVPALRGWAWPGAVVLGLCLYVAFSLKTVRDVPARKVLQWWCLAIVAAVAAFMVLEPSGHEIHGGLGVLSGVTFAALGLRHGPRLLILGAAILLTSVVVHLTLGPGQNLLFMGLFGGGGMMLGAAWLARA